MLYSKFTQVFVNLPPQKQIVYGLVSIVVFLVGIIPAIIVYEENQKSIIQTKLDEKDRIHAVERKIDNDEKIAILNRYFDFVEKELNNKYQLKKEVDSITSIKKK